MHLHRKDRMNRDHFHPAAVRLFVPPRDWAFGGEEVRRD